jgi:hypothetical protein
MNKEKEHRKPFLASLATIRQKIKILNIVIKPGIAHA